MLGSGRRERKVQYSKGQVYRPRNRDLSRKRVHRDRMEEWKEGSGAGKEDRGQDLHIYSTRKILADRRKTEVVTLLLRVERDALGWQKSALRPVSASLLRDRCRSPALPPRPLGNKSTNASSLVREARDKRKRSPGDIDNSLSLALAGFCVACLSRWSGILLVFHI